MSKLRKEEDLQNIYNYITAYFAERNLPPTQREIADANFLSRATVTRYLDILSERGLIIREDGLARGISLPREMPSRDNSPVDGVPHDSAAGKDCDEDEEE